MLLINKGILILQVWCIVNMFPAVFSLFYIAAGKHAPALQMTHSNQEIGNLSAKVLATIDGLGIMANALIIAYCASSFFIVSWIRQTKKASYLAVFAASVLLVQIAGYVSDWLFYEGQNLYLLHLSSLILLAGIMLCIFNKRIWQASEAGLPKI